MKKIFLVGDSIRIGYCKYVKEALKGSCEVYFPADNCRFSQYVLRFIGDWKKNLGLGDDIDLVHWNAGLWDTDTLYGDEPLTPIEYYKSNIDRICKRIKLLFPNAQVIFATSTPVVEERYAPTFCRKNALIEKYNAAAVEIVKQHGFAVNDLYAACKGMPASYYIDATHPYTPEGTQRLTSTVLNVLCEALELPKQEFTLTTCEEIKNILGI